MSAVGADGRRYPVRPVRVCGRELKGRAALSTHAKKCSQEQARSAAFIARIESGTS